MANRKEYEMLFKLNAQLGGSYNSTFSKAQQQISATQKEISALNKIQGDIASYNKQQQAINSTSQKLDSLKKQYELIEKEIKETEGSTSGLEREKLKLGDRIKDLETKLENENDKLGATKARLEEAGVDTNNLGAESEKAAAKIEELRKEQENAASGAQDFGSKGSSAIQAVGAAIAAAGIAVALKEIYAQFKACSEIAADFEATMSTVEALSGAGAEDMAALSEKAKELGATTKFTATEAAQAMTYMGMAGWSASEMLDGMNGVMMLAAASGEDLAMVSDIVTDNLTAFGLTAKDTARFADVLAAAATNSNTSVAVMGETFKNAASVAGALGYSVEDVSVAVGLMANSGVKGSRAGTALRNTFNGLLEGVTLTSNAFGEYEYSAVRADGTMKSFSSTIEELRTYFDQMTEAEKVNNAITIAGQRGYNGLLAILNSTTEDYNALTAAINDSSGAAERMANIQLDNYRGQVTLMNSAMDGLKVTIGEELNPALRDGASVATTLLTKANDFLKKHPGIIKAGTAIVGVIGAAVVGITGYTAVMKLATAATAAFATVSSIGLGPILAVVGGVALLTGGIVALISKYNEGVDSVKSLTEATREMDSVFKESAEAYGKTEKQTMATTTMASQYIDKLEELEAQGLDSAESQKEYNLTVDKLNAILPELNAHIDEETGLVEGGTEALREYVDAWKDKALMEAMQKRYNDELAAWADAQVEIVSNEQKLKKVEADRAVAQDKLAAVTERYNGLVEEQNALWGGIEDPKYWELETQISACAAEMAGYNTEIRKSDKEIKNLNKAIDQGNGTLAEYESQVQEARDLIDQFNQSSSDTAQVISPLPDMIDNVAAEVEALTEAYKLSYEEAYKSISGQYELWDTADKVVATSVSSMNKNLESQAKYWTDYQGNIELLTSKVGEIDGLREVIASFADGSTDSVNAIAGMADALRKGDDGALQKLVSNYQDVQKAQEDAAASLSELTTGYSEEMDKIAAELAEDVAALNLSDDAKESGKSTIQGFIDGAESMLPAVQNAYNNIANRARAALLLGYVPTVAADNAYASGTENARAGVALVGEEGPELVLMRGGEKVLSARDTASAVLPSRAISNTVAVAFNIEGNATADVVEALRDFGEEFERKVLDVIDNAGMNARRTAYA
jgi:TP901 family phage tail tape measure protein